MMISIMHAQAPAISRLGVGVGFEALLELLCILLRCFCAIQNGKC